MNLVMKMKNSAVIALLSGKLKSPFKVADFSKTQIESFLKRIKK